MIKFEHTEVMGWDAAIRGMRNPLESWEKSDSYWDMIEDPSPINPNDEFGVIIGPNDLDLMKRLRDAGTDHRKFLRMIVVYVDITAPLYWWKEFDTYKVGTVANSCSTMHCIQKHEFTLDDFSHERLLSLGPCCDSNQAIIHTIKMLNFWRERFNERDKDREEYFKYNGYPYVPSKKECWWQMIQLLPSSYNQKRTVMMSYEALANMYHARKNHKLDEWAVDKPGSFCRWIKSLPYSELITGGADSEKV